MLKKELKQIMLDEINNKGFISLYKAVALFGENNGNETSEVFEELLTKHRINFITRNDIGFFKKISTISH